MEGSVPPPAANTLAGDGHQCRPNKDSLRGSSVNIRTMQRRLAWTNVGQILLHYTNMQISIKHTEQTKRHDYLQEQSVSEVMLT